MTIDTIHQKIGNDSCFLPFIAPFNSAPEAVIVTTSNKKYALVRLTSNITTVQCHEVVGTAIYQWTQSRLTGYTVTWHIQNNGQPYFAGINQSGVGNGSQLTSRQYQTAITPGAEAYSLLGRRVSLAQIERNRAHSGLKSLYIVKAPGALRLMLK